MNEKIHLTITYLRIFAQAAIVEHILLEDFEIQGLFFLFSTVHMVKVSTLLNMDCNVPYIYILNVRVQADLCNQRSEVLVVASIWQGSPICHS